VTTALTGAKRTEQVAENAGGVGWRIKAADLEQIEAIVAGLTDLA
jgi:aryl-alcohol dehydrogenase-like predicted oxidoreductase